MACGAVGGSIIILSYHSSPARYVEESKTSIFSKLQQQVVVTPNWIFFKRSHSKKAENNINHLPLHTTAGWNEPEATCWHDYGRSKQLINRVATYDYILHIRRGIIKKQNNVSAMHSSTISVAITISSCCFATEFSYIATTTPSISVNYCHSITRHQS